MKNAARFDTGVMHSMNKLMQNNLFYQRYMWFLLLDKIWNRFCFINFLCLHFQSVFDKTLSTSCGDFAIWFVHFNGFGNPSRLVFTQSRMNAGLETAQCGL